MFLVGAYAKYNWPYVWVSTVNSCLYNRCRSCTYGGSSGASGGRATGTSCLVRWQRHDIMAAAGGEGSVRYGQQQLLDQRQAHYVCLLCTHTTCSCAHSTGTTGARTLMRRLTCPAQISGRTRVSTAAGAALECLHTAQIDGHCRIASCPASSCSANSQQSQVTAHVSACLWRLWRQCPLTWGAGSWTYEVVMAKQRCWRPLYMCC